MIMNFLGCICKWASIFKPRVFQAGISEAAAIPEPPRQDTGKVSAEGLQAFGRQWISLIIMRIIEWYHHFINWCSKLWWSRIIIIYLKGPESKDFTKLSTWIHSLLMITFTTRIVNYFYQSISQPIDCSISQSSS